MENALGFRYAHSLTVVRDKFSLKQTWILLFIMAAVVSAVWKPDVARALEIPGAKQIAILQLYSKPSGLHDGKRQFERMSWFYGHGGPDHITRATASRSAIGQSNAVNDADRLPRIAQSQLRAAIASDEDGIEEGPLSQRCILVGVSREFGRANRYHEPEDRQNANQYANQHIAVFEGKAGSRDIDTITTEADGGPLVTKLAVLAALGVGAMWIITLLGILSWIDHPFCRSFQAVAGIDIVIGGFFCSLCFTYLLWLLWP